MNVISILKMGHIGFLLPLTYITVSNGTLAHKHINYSKNADKDNLSSVHVAAIQFIIRIDGEYEP